MMTCQCAQTVAKNNKFRTREHKKSLDFSPLSAARAEKSFHAFFLLRGPLQECIHELFMPVIHIYRAGNCFQIERFQSGEVEKSQVQFFSFFFLHSSSATLLIILFSFSPLIIRAMAYLDWPCPTS